jgi:hypothetical protein
MWEIRSPDDNWSVDSARRDVGMSPDAAMTLIPLGIFGAFFVLIAVTISLRVFRKSRARATLRLLADSWGLTVGEPRLGVDSEMYGQVDGMSVTVIPTTFDNGRIFSTVRVVFSGVSSFRLDVRAHHGADRDVPVGNWVPMQTGDRRFDAHFRVSVGSPQDAALLTDQNRAAMSAARIAGLHLEYDGMEVVTRSRRALRDLRAVESLMGLVRSFAPAVAASLPPAAPDYPQPPSNFPPQAGTFPPPPGGYILPGG